MAAEGGKETLDSSLLTRPVHVQYMSVPWKPWMKELPHFLGAVGPVNTCGIYVSATCANDVILTHF